MCTRLAIAGWLAWLVVAACGRVGFDERQPASGGTIDAHRGSAADADPLAPDAPPGSADGPSGGGDAVPPGDGAAACGYVACQVGRVACCDSGSADCVNDTATCTRRFECDAMTDAGCAAPNICCLTQDSLGTVCINPATDPCFG